MPWLITGLLMLWLKTKSVLDPALYTTKTKQTNKTQEI